MAQTYKMKHNPQGTIYSLLTVESDGRMTITFHGMDREISHEATQTDDGWITTGGSLFPGLKSGRWQLMDDGRCKMEDEPSDISHQTSAIDQPRVRRQRKPRKPRVERQPSDISHQTSDIDLQPSAIDRHQPSDIIHQTSDRKNLFAAVGMVAAVSVALFVIYETGLLIPLGLIGLATGGILK